jgi:hypothetical protein
MTGSVTRAGSGAGSGAGPRRGWSRGRLVRWAALSPDRGSAVVEFCFLAVLLMVPLLYVLLTVFEVQAATYAVAAATREAGRAFTTTGKDGDPPLRAYQAANLAMGDHGLELAPGQLAIDCPEGTCTGGGAAVRVAIAVEVPLPFLPAVLDGAVPASVRVEGTHLEHVDRFRAVG